MKRLLKVLIVLIVLLLLLTGGAVYGVRSWVESDKGVARIQAELGRAIGMPLEIGHATLGWGGVRLVDVKIKSEDQTFLEAPAFTTEYQILPLLSRQVVLRKMVLESPKVVWPQNAEGKWVLPTRAKGLKSTTPSAPKAPPAEKEFQLALDTLEINDGTIEMLDAKGVRFAFAEKVQIKASLANVNDVKADATAARVALLEKGPVLGDVVFPFQYTAGKLTFPKCEGTLGGGSLNGSFSMDTKAADSPFDLQLALERVDLARAMSDPEWQIRSGQLRAALTLHSASGGTQRGLGGGEIHLSQASVESLEPLLRLIGESCHVPELANLKLSVGTLLGQLAPILSLPDITSLRSADAVFKLQPNGTVIDSLSIDSGDLMVTAKGGIGDDGKLKLDANLGVSAELQKRLPTFVKNTLKTEGPNGQRGINFSIGGKNDHSKTDLLDQMLGKTLPLQFNEVVRNLFDGKKDKGDEEKKKKDKDKDKGMTDEEKKAKKERKDKEKKEKEAALANGASPDAKPIPGQTPDGATPPAPAVTAPGTPAPAEESVPPKPAAPAAAPAEPVAN